MSTVRGLRRLLAVPVLTLIAACQPAPSTSPAISLAPASQQPPSQAASVAPSAPTAAARLRLVLADAPFIRPEDGPEGSVWDMPAAGTRDRDGRLVLVVIWFEADNAPPRITISTSADGETWDVGQTPILAGVPIGDPDPGPIPAAIVQLDDGSWQLYGWAAADPSGRRFWTWRASAPSLDGPWAVDGTEMLEPGPTGAWDSQMAAVDSVLVTADGYAMWYSGEPPGSVNRGDIGLATSADGLAWTKHDDPATSDDRLVESDPVIPAGICGASTDVAVEQAQVERVGEEYVALFGGFAAVNHTMDLFGATSPDGRTWECASPEALLMGSQLGGGDGIHTLASVPLADGRIGLIAESIAAGGLHSELWWATVEVLPKT